MRSLTTAGTTLSFGPATRAAEPPFEPATHAHSLARKPATGGFNRIPVCSIENLSDGVLGAGLEVAQLSNAPAVGSLAFLAEDGILCSTGRLTARVALSGPLSHTMITLGVGLRMPPGTRQWLNGVSSGVVGIFLSGDEHDAYYVPGTLYATVTLPAERLEQVAERVGLVLDARTLGGTGIVDRALETGMLASLQARFERLHDGRDSGSPQLGRDLLDAFILHLGRDPRPLIGGTRSVWIWPHRRASARLRSSKFGEPDLDRRHRGCCDYVAAHAPPRVLPCTR